MGQIKWALVFESADNKSVIELSPTAEPLESTKTQDVRDAKSIVIPHPNN